MNKSVSAFSGLTQVGARAYNPALGKFLSVDPVLAPDNPQQNNGYTYAANSPITNMDPTGLNYIGGGGTNHVTAPGATDTKADPPPPAAGNSSHRSWTPKPTHFVEQGSKFGIGGSDGVQPYSSKKAFALGIASNHDQHQVTIDLFILGGALTLGTVGVGVCVAASVICAGVIAGGSEGAAEAGGGVTAGALRDGAVVDGAVDDAAPAIKAGPLGGPTAGKAFSQSVKNEVLQDNPETCAYCRMHTDSPQVDHVIP